MTILVQLEINVKPECVEELTGMIKDRFPETRVYDGCKEITAYLNEDGHTMVFVEHWESKEHYQKYFDWREETGVLAELSALLDGPPEIRYFSTVDA